MFDSHCHLADEVFANEIEQVAARAQEAGVRGALCILAMDDPEERVRAPRIRAAWPDVRFAIGIHPHAAAKAWSDRDGALARLAATLADDELRPVALGEVGLDYHYDFAPRDVQQDIFRRQLRLARERTLPVIIHTREATDDTFAILKEEGGGKVTGVFHCFTGDVATARRVLDMGFHISLSGIVTFPRAGELREVSKLVPADRLLIETDSPYLAPVPLRGKRNEPAFVPYVAAAVARARQESAERVGASTTAVFQALFGGNAGPDRPRVVH